MNGWVAVVERNVLSWQDTVLNACIDFYAEGVAIVAAIIWLWRPPARAAIACRIMAAWQNVANMLCVGFTMCAACVRPLILSTPEEVVWRATSFFGSRNCMLGSFSDERIYFFPNDWSFLAFLYPPVTDDATAPQSAAIEQLCCGVDILDVDEELRRRRRLPWFVRGPSFVSRIDKGR